MRATCPVVFETLFWSYSMKTSFETYAQFISPWEFTIVLDGKEYPTRPFTLADVAYLQTHEKDDAANVGRLIEFVKGIFTGEVKPDVDRWPLEYMPMMLATLGAYF